METVTDQIEDIYLDSNIEESESEDDTFEQLRCDAVEVRAKIGERIEKNNKIDVVKVDEASNFGTCSFAPKRNCPKFSGKN